MVFVKAQVVVFEEGTVCVAAEVAVKSGEDGFAHAASAIRIDVAQPPCDTAAVAVIGKCVGHKGSGWRQEVPGAGIFISKWRPSGAYCTVFFSGPSRLTIAAMPSL